MSQGYQMQQIEDSDNTYLRPTKVLTQVMNVLRKTTNSLDSTGNVLPGIYNIRTQTGDGYTTTQEVEDETGVSQGSYEHRDCSHHIICLYTRAHHAQNYSYADMGQRSKTYEFSVTIRRSPRLSLSSVFKAMLARF